MQLVWPIAPWYFPLLHDPQRSCCLVANFPAPQLVQESAPAEDTVPLPHSVHVSTDDSNFPAVQVVQVLAPAEDTEPSTHVRQEALPLLDA